MTFLKRLIAILVALLLIAQLVACSTEQSASHVDSVPQIESGDEISSENTTTSSEDNTHVLDDNNSNEENSNEAQSSSNQNSIQEHPSSKEDTTSSTKPVVPDEIPENNTSSKEDKPQEPTYDYTKPLCNHDIDYSDPYTGVNKTTFYSNYKTACCNLEAKYRSKHGLLSGSLDVPGQYVQEASNRPKSQGKFIRNTSELYLDNGNTYIVINSDGKEILRIHKAGGYITLEEVAAYMFAFGGNEQIPANYTSSKKTKPSSSIWGEYLRVNHSYFIGDTDKYPYEPELPNISGCGGDLRYYEMDIGTTGTVTPGYAAKPYIDGNKVNRGAARIVYTRYDLNKNGTIENDEVYVFYTHNHYNDFREYLNYYGGWGEMFGNVTGGGEYSSETRANPTPYVLTAYANLSKPQ